MATLQEISPRDKDISRLLAAEANGTLGPQGTRILSRLRESEEIPPNLKLNTGFAEGLSEGQFQVISSFLNEFRANPGAITDSTMSPVMQELVRQNPDLFQFDISGRPSLKVQPGRESRFGPRRKSFGEELKSGALPAVGATIGSIAGGVGGATLGGGAGQSANILLGISEPPETVLGRASEIGQVGLTEGLLESVFRGLGFAGRLGKPSLTARTLASPEVRLAQREGVELSLSQATQSSPIIVLDSLLKRALGTQKAFRGQQLRQNADLTAFFDRLANNISTTRMSRRQLGLVMDEQVRLVKRAAGQAIADAETAAGKKFSGVPFEFGTTTETSIRNVLEQVESSELPGASGLVKKVNKLLFDNEQLTLGDALRAAKDLRVLSAGKGEVKGAAKKIRGDVLDAITANLDSIGATKESGALKATRARYRELIQAMDTSFIRSLAKNRAPEAIAIKLTSRTSGISNAAALKTIFGKEVPRDVRRAFAEEIFGKAQKSGVLPGNSLENVIDQVGEDTIRAVLKKEEADVLINQIRTLADLIDLPANITRPVSSTGPSLLGFGQSGAATAGAVQATRGEVIQGAAITFGTLGLPVALARILTSTTGPKLIQRLSVIKNTGTQIGPKFILRILAAALEEESFRNPKRTLSSLPKERERSRK